MVVSMDTNENVQKTKLTNPASIGAPLWSWLVMAETRSEYYCPPTLNVTIQDLFSALREHLANNHIPAQAKLVEVDWDESGTLQTRILIRYTGPEQGSDIVQLLVGVDQVGRFAYVEKKTLIHPPVLPAKPRKRNDSESGLVLLLIVGIAIAGVGFFSALGSRNLGIILFCLLAVLVGLLIIWRCSKHISSIKQWNNMSIQEKMIWNKPWENWLKEKSLAVYVKKTNNLFDQFIRVAAGFVEEFLKKVVDRETEPSNGNPQLRNRTDSVRGFTVVLVMGVGIAGIGFIIAFQSSDFGRVIFCLLALLSGVAIIWRCATKISSVNEWNAASTQEKKEWDKTWEDWLEKRLRAAYLRKTNDVFGRFIDAASSSTEQVVTKLFVDQEAELRKQTEQQRTQEEIEKEMEKKRQEAMA